MLIKGPRSQGDNRFFYGKAGPRGPTGLKEKQKDLEEGNGFPTNLGFHALGEFREVQVLLTCYGMAHARGIREKP